MDINKIKITLLETEYQNFLKCSSNFLTDKYELFQNSYLTKCEDSRFKRMASRLDEQYTILKKGYQNISKWWENYLKNSKGIESALAQKGNRTITESDLLSYITQHIESLSSFEEKIESILSPSLIQEVSTAINSFQSALSSLQNLSNVVSSAGVAGTFSVNAVSGLSSNRTSVSGQNVFNTMRVSLTQSLNESNANAVWSTQTSSVLNLQNTMERFNEKLNQNVSNSGYTFFAQEAQGQSIGGSLNGTNALGSKDEVSSGKVNSEVFLQNMGGTLLTGATSAYIFQSAYTSNTGGKGTSSSSSVETSSRTQNQNGSATLSKSEAKRDRVTATSQEAQNDDLAISRLVEQQFNSEDWESVFLRNLENAKIMSKACDATQKELESQYDELEEGLNFFLKTRGHSPALKTEFYSSIDDDAKALTPEEYEKKLMFQLYSNADDSFGRFNYQEEQKEIHEKVEAYTIEFNKAFEQAMGKSYEEYQNEMTQVAEDLAVIKASKYTFDQQVKMSPYLSIMYSEEFQDYKKNYQAVSENYKPDLFHPNPIRMAEFYEARDINYAARDRDVFKTSEIQSVTRFQLMTDNKKKLYCFLFEEKSYKEAEKYIKAMEDTLAKREAIKESVDFLNSVSTDKIEIDYTSPTVEQDFIDAVIDLNVGDEWYASLSAAGEGFFDGIETFGEGIANVYNTKGTISENQYKQMFVLQALSEKIIVSGAYELGVSAGNMAPSIAISIAATAVAGPAGAGLSQATAASIGSTAGYISTGVSVFGNAKNQALVSGNSLAAATLYGTCTGISEVALGKLLGNIGFLNENAEFGVTKIFNEMVEEGLQSYVEAGLDAAILNEEIDFTSLHGEALKSALFGGILSMVTTGGEQVIRITANNINYRLTMAQAMEVINRIDADPNRSPTDIVNEVVAETKTTENIVDSTETITETTVDSSQTTDTSSVTTDTSSRSILKDAFSLYEKITSFQINFWKSVFKTGANVIRGVVNINTDMTQIRTDILNGMLDTGGKIATNVQNLLTGSDNLEVETPGVPIGIQTDGNDSSTNSNLFEFKTSFQDSDSSSPNLKTISDPTSKPENAENPLVEEYNNLLDSDDRLPDLITKGNDGETIHIPEELIDAYLRLRSLEYEILHPDVETTTKSSLFDQIKVKISETIAKITEKPLSAWSDLKEIKVSNLFDVLKQTFQRNTDRSSQSYINQLNQVNRENNPLNVGELKTGIIESMPQGLSEIEQARYIYLELGKKLDYNKNFDIDDATGYLKNKEIYNMEITDDTDVDSGVICSNWAAVYSNMLNSLGIEAHVAGEHRSLSHQWVEFEVDGHYFYADATQGSLMDLARISAGEQTQEFYEIYGYSDNVIPQAKSREIFDKYLETVDRKIDYLNDFNYPDVIESVQKSSSSIDEGLMTLSDTVLCKLGYIEAKSYLLEYVRSLDTDRVSGTDLTKTLKNGQKDIVNITCVLQEDGSYKYYALHEGLGLQEVTVEDINALMLSGYKLKEGKSIKGYEYNSMNGLKSLMNSFLDSTGGKITSFFKSIFSSNDLSQTPTSDNLQSINDSETSGINEGNPDSQSYVDILKENILKIKPALDSTAKTIVISSLEGILKNKNVFELFKNMDFVKDKVEGFGKNEVIVAISELKQALENAGYVLTDMEQQHYQEIIDMFDFNLEKILGKKIIKVKNSAGEVIKISVKYMQDILLDETIFQDFIQDPSIPVIRKEGVYLAFEQVYEILSSKNIPLISSIQNELIFFHDTFKNIVNKSKEAFENLKTYGIGQGAVHRDLTGSVNDRYKLLFNKVKEVFSGIKDTEVYKFLNGMDAGGICGYATIANEIFMVFHDNVQEFKEKFKYDLYTEDGGINDSLLLLDIYLFLNKECKELIDMIDGEWKVLGTDDSGVHPIHSWGREAENLNQFLKFLGIDYTMNPNQIFNNIDHRYHTLSEKQIETLRNEVIYHLAKGDKVSLGIFPYLKSPNNGLTFYCTQGSENINTNNWEETTDNPTFYNGGHSMYVTGISDSGDLIVSSWGKEYIVKWSELSTEAAFEITATSYTPNS